MIANSQTKLGFKKTKLGWIPEDWDSCKFSDIPDPDVKWSLTGGPFGSDLKSSDYVDEPGVRIIQLQNIGDGKFLNSYKIYTSPDKADELLGCNIYPGDLILSKMGDPVTRTCIIPDFQERFLMASDGIRLVPNYEKFDKKFVLEYINHSLFRNKAIAHSTGSTRQRIGLGDLKKLPFVCPPLPEQQKIATILSTWDKAIDKLSDLITEKEKLKKGLMQQLLTGKMRFPGFTDEWKEVKLGEVFTIKRGGSPRPIKEYLTDDPKGLNWIKIGDTKGVTKYIYNVAEKIKSEGLNKTVEVFEDDFILSNSMSFGKPYIMKTRGCIHDGWLVLRRNTELNIDFMYYLLGSHVVYGKLTSMAAGSTVKNLNKEIVSSVKVKIPSLEEQLSISTMLSILDKEIEKLNKELNALKEQKRGLMQKLLSGEVRVKIN